jgi:hypothetical protein
MAEQYVVLAISSLTSGAKVNVRSSPIPFAGRIRRVVVKANANALGAATFDINLEGASIFAAPGDRPVLAAGQTQVVLSNLSVAHAENAVVSFDADSIPLGGLTEVSVTVVCDDMKADEPAPIEFFIRKFYLGALNREPTTAELNTYLTSLTTGCFSFGFVTAAQAMATAIFTSLDFTGLVLTDEQKTVRLYKSYLGRDPVTDPTGLAYWTGRVTGEGFETIRALFAGSVEFRNRAPLFCRSQAPSADASSIEGKTPLAFVQDSLDTVYTVVVTTTALANNAGANVSVNMLAKFYEIIQITSDRAARVRSYSRAAYRTADVTRAIGTDPVGEHGLMSEFVVEASNLTLDCSPIPKGMNLDDLTSTQHFFYVENLSGATSTVTLTFKIRKV